MSTIVDASLIAVDGALRTLFAPHRASRPTPVPRTLEAEPAVLSAAEQALSAALMRVNHVGEICAQALYTSQALAARPRSRHLAGARAPRAPSGSRRTGRDRSPGLVQAAPRRARLAPSLLNPLWYAGAFGIGLLASRLGRATSLGFVIETERQVEAHLDSHLDQLPAQDHASRAIVQQMKDDEVRHADEAQAAGGVELPAPVRGLMRASAKVMTTIAHRI